MSDLATVRAVLAEYGAVDYDPEIVQAAFERAIVGAYDRGFEDGLAAYAWWKDGVCYVGTTGRTLNQAGAEMRETWNYAP